MAKKKIIAEQKFLRRPPYIVYAYAELNLKKTAHPSVHGGVIFVGSYFKDGYIW